MTILGPYSGNKEKAVSYLYGKHWENQIGYKLIQGKEEYKHYFGGNSWKVPQCKICNKEYHQIITLDLNDKHLKELYIEGLDELPLISCLNCSSSWGTQLFQINILKKEILKIEDNSKEEIYINESEIPTPLPKVELRLEAMSKDDIPTNKEKYYDILEEFGKNYICRVLGAPVYEQNPIDRECPYCKEEMQYIATIKSQPYNEKGKVIEGVDFFLGEMSLYYFICKKCLVIKVECQGT